MWMKFSRLPPYCLFIVYNEVCALIWFWQMKDVVNICKTISTYNSCFNVFPRMQNIIISLCLITFFLQERKNSISLNLSKVGMNSSKSTIDYMSRTNNMYSNVMRWIILVNRIRFLLYKSKSYLYYDWEFESSWLS